MLTPALLGIAYLLVVAWPLAKTDLREHRLPNRLVLPAFPITLAGQLLAVMWNSNWMQLLHSLAVALLVFAVGLVMNRYAGLGMGDVKLLAAMSLALGWFSSTAVFLGMLVALVLASIAVLIRIHRATSAVPLGPYLLAGFLCATFSIWQ